jgi:ferritin-like metal-binding protein YciE
VAALAYLSYQPMIQASELGGDTADTRTLFHTELVSIFSLEVRMRDKLLDYAERARSTDLRDAFLSESERTTEYMDRLRQVFMLVGLPTDEKLCKGMEGLLDDAEDQVREYRNDPLLDLVLILNARKLEYLAMASYVTLTGLARQMGEDDLVELMQLCLDEHGQWDQGLYDLSKEVAMQPSEE